MTKLTLALVASLAMLVPVAQAEALLDAANPAALYELARGYGSAELGKTERGNPKIKGRMDGMAYTIFFLQCDMGEKCRDVQLTAGWSGYEVSQAQLSAWNSSKNYSKAYLDDENDPILEMDVVMSPGMSPAAFERALGLWQQALRDFRKEVLKVGE